ncbi:PEGA domain-containing protein [Verrucomicrobiota bacterium]
MARDIVKRGLVLIVVAVVALFGSGCASILSTSRQKLKISTTPPGAKISINGKTKGVTPAVVKVKRADMQKITMVAAGYDTHEVVLDQYMNWLTWGNVIFFPGIFVDMGTGAAVKHVPSTIDVKLMKKGTTPPVKPPPMLKSISIPKDKALVIFYRKRKMAGAAVPIVIKEGATTLGAVRGNRCFAKELPPGKHVFDGGMHVYQGKREMTLQAGKVYYIRAELGGVLIVMPDWQAAKELQRFRLPRRRR